MTQKNRYFSRSKISEAKFRQIARYFAMDLAATDCAQLSGMSLRSVNSIYLRIRRRLAAHCEEVSPLKGELEADESYFGPRRIRGLRGRGYDGLVDVGFNKHLRVNHGNNEFARGSVHANGIESFWSYAN